MRNYAKNSKRPQTDIDVNVERLSIIDAISLNRKRKSRAIRKYLQRRLSNTDEETLIIERDLLTALRQLAKSRGGLVSDEHRQKVWPILAESKSQEQKEWQQYDSMTDCESDYESALSSIVDDLDIRTTSLIDLGEPTIDDLRTHREWNQVEMDVCRTLARFPPNISDKRRSILQQQLTPLIIRVLWDNSNYHYYQGFHDVCLTILLVLGQSSALHVCRRLASFTPFYRYLTEPLEQSVVKPLELVYVLLWLTDPELELFLRQSRSGTLFALSWTLTWFAHSIDQHDVVVRLYDLFLASHSSMPLYFSTALVLFRSSDILDNCDCDVASVHSLLSKLPDNMPYEALMADAQDLMLRYPPDRLAIELSACYREKVSREITERREMRISRFGGRNRPLSRKAFQFVLWAGTASVAVWYFYAKYGIRKFSWMHVF